MGNDCDGRCKFIDGAGGIGLPETADIDTVSPSHAVLLCPSVQALSTAPDLQMLLLQ